MAIITNKFYKARQAKAMLDKAPTTVANPTGTATRTTFATGSVTLPQLAEAVNALILDLKTSGIVK